MILGEFLGGKIGGRPHAVTKTRGCRGSRVIDPFGPTQAPRFLFSRDLGWCSGEDAMLGAPSFAHMGTIKKPKRP